MENHYKLVKKSTVIIESKMRSPQSMEITNE